MTESQWRRCAEPTRMFPILRGLTTGRKLRLFAVACCRRVVHVLPDDRISRALDAAERLADGRIDVADLADAEARVKAVRADVNPLADARQWDAVTAAVIAISHASCAEDEERLAANALVAARRVARSGNGSVAEAESSAHAHLIREVFGDPVRPARFSSQWRTATAVLLATQMYETKDFGAMPILADALQDAGCDNEDILDHCRDANATHVRGCWVVDLVLDKQ